MLLKKCTLCDVIITKDNDSREHIIPNSIGGRKKISGFICNSCNNLYGHKWDSELASQLNPLSLIFEISRERDSVPSQIFETTAGYKLKLHPDGSMSHEKPIISISPIESELGHKIYINARSKSELKQIFKNLKRKKYPQLDVDMLFDQAEYKSSYCNDMLKFNLQFGGHKVGRSIVKSALAMVVNSGISVDYCIEALDYLKNDEANACFGYYYESDPIKCRPKGIPLHCISIKGSSKTQQIIAYVEYFGVQRMVLGLSSSYDGDDIATTYAINPITGEELELIVELNHSRQEIRDAYDYKKIPQGSIEAAFDGVIPTTLKVSFENEKNRVVNEAIKYAFENCGIEKDALLMPDNVKKLTQLIMSKLEPFITHQISQSRNG